MSHFPRGKSQVPMYVVLRIPEHILCSGNFTMSLIILGPTNLAHGIQGHVPEVGTSTSVISSFLVVIGEQDSQANKVTM